MGSKKGDKGETRYSLDHPPRDVHYRFNREVAAKWDSEEEGSE